jgi:hypothetical protein
VPSKKSSPPKPSYHLQPYRDAGGDSGVTGYILGSDFIVVEFTDSKAYLYNTTKPGRRHVAEMKKLATAGKGLATYINQYVREHYAKRLR